MKDSFCLKGDCVVMEGRMRNQLVAVLVFAICNGLWTRTSAQSSLEEQFSEELLLRPLSDGKVLAHFHFTNSLPPINLYGHHHRLFPKAIYQLVKKFHIQEMEISFTQGRWNYDRWGGMDSMASSNVKPAGVELWADFGVPDEQIDSTWRNLTHALSGLFCASVNFLESPLMVATPVHTFRPGLDVVDSGGCILEGRSIVGRNPSRQQSSLNHINPICSLDASTSRRGRDTKDGKKGFVGRVRYGALPREAVCTENLTPWLKLLPCRDKAGLTVLLDRPTIYKVSYHSLRLHVESGEFNFDAVDGQKGTVLQQTLTLVLRPTDTSRMDQSMRMQPDWSISSLFGRNLDAGCPLAKSSVVYLELESTFVDTLEHLEDTKNGQEGTPQESGFENIDEVSNALEGLANMQKAYTSNLRKESNSGLGVNFVDNVAYVLHVAPQRVLRGMECSKGMGHGESSASVLLEFEMKNQERISSVDVGISWKISLQWPPLRGPFRASRFLAGSGNARGTIAMTLKNNHLQMKRISEHVTCLETKERAFGESHTVDATDVLIFQIVPWYIRLYFHTLQVIVDEQPRPLWEVMKWMQVSPSEDRKSPGVIEMELKLPFNVSRIALTIQFDKGFLRIDEHPPDANRGFDLPAALISFPFLHTGRHYRIEGSTSPMLQSLQKDRSVQLYTEVLLVPLATPDFSMPYNVITLTCTVMALYFGSLLNVLRRRVGEEEQLARRAASSMGAKLKQRLQTFVSKFTKRKEQTFPLQHLGLIKIFFVVFLAVVVHYYISYS